MYEDKLSNSERIRLEAFGQARVMPRQVPASITELLLDAAKIEEFVKGPTGLKGDVPEDLKGDVRFGPRPANIKGFKRAKE